MVLLTGRPRTAGFGAKSRAGTEAVFQPSCRHLHALCHTRDVTPAGLRRLSQRATETIQLLCQNFEYRMYLFDCCIFF